MTLVAVSGMLRAQDTQTCPCLIDNDIDALYAVSVHQEFSFDIEMSDGITAEEALIQVALKVLDNIPDVFSYYIKVTAGGQIRYAKISSCQIALEKAYDLLQLGVDEVRIISDTWASNVNVSCSNRSYTRNDLKDLKNRRDKKFGGRF